MRNTIFSIIAIVLFSTITIFALEYLVRYIRPAYDPSGNIAFVQKGPSSLTLGPASTAFRQVKNTGDFDVLIKFNQHGFRDDRDVATAVAEDYLVVGDSLGFGWGVEEEDRITEQIEKLTALRLFNLCIPGGLESNRTTLNYAKSLGAQAENLLLLFSTEVRIRDYDAAEAKETIHRPTDGWFKRIKLQLMSNSALYFLVTTFVHQTPPLRELAIKSGLIIPSLEGIPKRIYDPEAIRSTVRHIADLGKGYKRFVVVVIPSRGLWTGSTQELEKQTHAELLAQLRSAGIEFVDIRETFEKHAENPLDQFFFKNDSHWSPKGHALAAPTVASHILAPAK